MRSRRTILVLLTAAALAGAVLVETQPAGAATFEVTRRDDPNPNGCAANDCSLREAVIRANNNAGPDTIELRRGNYVLRIAGMGENDSQTGDLDIKERVTIVGRGPGRTSVDANGIDRAFEVRGAASGVILKDLTITGGEVDATPSIDPATPDGGGGLLVLGGARLNNVVVADNSSPNCCGGGIYNNGRLTLVDSRVTGNTAYDCCGGGIANVDGRLKVLKSRIDHNRAFACCGGAIWNSHEGRVNVSRSKLDNNKAPSCCGGAIFATDPNTFVRINRSRVTGNNADSCCGGGLFIYQGADGLILRSRFDHNTADSCCGGAIFADDADTEVELRRSRLHSNDAWDCCGGGLYTTADTTVLRTSIRNNTAHRDCCGGGVYLASPGSLVMRESTVSGNRSTGEQGTGGLGGGLYLGNPTTDTLITGTTISKNFSADRGGGIYNGSGTKTELLNSTLSGNTTLTDGGGIAHEGSALVEFTHVTVARNHARDDGGGAFFGSGTFDVFRSLFGDNGPDDCDTPLTGAVGRNMDSDSTCFTGPSAIHANPRILKLADNGGPTKTHALRASSRAVDAAAANACPPPPRDQRGVSRPKNGDGQPGARCDLGAYERNP